MKINWFCFTHYNRALLRSWWISTWIFVSQKSSFVKYLRRNHDLWVFQNLILLSLANNSRRNLIYVFFPFQKIFWFVQWYVDIGWNLSAEKSFFSLNFHSIWGHSLFKKTAILYKVFHKSLPEQILPTPRVLQGIWS